LERIFHEKCDAEKKREPADPREQFRAHELLPIDRRFGWSGDLRRARFEKVSRDLRWVLRFLRDDGGRGDRWNPPWGGVPFWVRRRPRGPPVPKPNSF